MPKPVFAALQGYTLLSFPWLSSEPHPAAKKSNPAKDTHEHVPLSCKGFPQPWHSTSFTLPQDQLQISQDASPGKLLSCV